jgi:hypothetical protein
MRIRQRKSSTMRELRAGISDGGIEIRESNVACNLKMRYRFLLAGIVATVMAVEPGFSQSSVPTATGQSSSESASPTLAATATAQDAGVVFVEGSVSQVVVVREGKRYRVDLATREIHEETAAAVPPANLGAGSDVAAASPQEALNQKPSAAVPVSEHKSARVYKPGDDMLFNVPTGRPVERHGLYINFTHRFPYEAAFTGPGRGATLLGLDDFSVSSLGLRYGITSKLSVLAYRSPSIIGRPIELMAAYNFLSENDGMPLNAAFRFSVDGQNDFSSNFAESFELVMSRSLGHRAQLYAVPTYSIHARPLLANPGDSLADAMPNQPCSAALAAGIPASFNARPCADTFSLGAGVSVDIRPTVALIAEATPTLVNGRALAIHRPEYSFGIQKKIWRHAFTFAFSNGPGSIVSQRAGTRATFVEDSTADKPGGLFVGFDLTRQLF